MAGEWRDCMESTATFRSLIVILLLSGLVSCSGGTAVNDRESSMTTPMTTIPIINPTNPGTTFIFPPPVPFPTPTTTAPAGGARSWCVASPTASQTALQVALDYACGYGGADCAAIQPGGACFSPDTLRDHASFAFNSYYQKNPIPTSCDFGGAAMLTTVDPSSLVCRFPASASPSSPVMGPANPGGSGPTVLGSTPPNFDDSSPAAATCPPVIFTLACLLITLLPSRY